jgi:hypothetical protein
MTRFRHGLSLSPVKKPQDLHLNNLRHSLSETINPVRSSIPGPPPASQASVAGRSDFRLLTSIPSPINKSSNQRIIYPFPQLSLDLDQTQPSLFQHFYFLDNGDMLRGIASLPAFGPQRNQDPFELSFPEPERRFWYIELLADLQDSYGLFLEVHLSFNFEKISWISLILIS